MSLVPLCYWRLQPFRGISVFHHNQKFISIEQAQLGVWSPVRMHTPVQ